MRRAGAKRPSGAPAFARPMVDRGLFLGRFQPMHLGHLAVVERLARRHDEVVLAIGSANVSHSRVNPFTAGERIEMVAAALRAGRLHDRVHVVPVPDLGRNALWVAHVASLVPRFTTLYTNNPLPARLFREAGYRVAAADFVERDRYEGTRVRKLMLEGGDWQTLVPPGVAEVIASCGGLARMKDLAVSDGVVEGFDPSV